MKPFRYPRFFAHRSGGALAPENTLAGLRLAARLGYRGVEFDVMLCADGIPVLIHDETLERTSDGIGEVARTSLVQLRRLDAGTSTHRAYAGEPIPTLEEALDCCAALGLVANIEIKPAQGEASATGEAVAAVIEPFRRGAEPPLLSSFSAEALAAARSLAPEAPRALLVDTVPRDWANRLTETACFALHCEAGSLDPALAAELRATGVPFACYTVNRTEQAARLFGLGAAAVFTDRLDLFDPAQ